MDFPEIREAAEALRSVCDGAREHDGAGFNGFDAPFARDLLSKISWSPRQASAMHKLLRKYKKQLAGFGIAYDALPVPEGAPTPALAQKVLVPHSPAPAIPAPRQSGPNVTLGQHEKFGTQFKVSFAFDAAVKDAFRAACKMTIWEPETKTWVVPARFAPELLAFAKEQGWQWSDDAMFEALTRSNSLREQVKAREEATKASSATDSPFMAEWECCGVKAGAPCPSAKKGTKCRLFPYQRAGAEYLVKKERAWLSDEMGLGKTLQALAAIQHTKAFPVLVICPASAVQVWKNEIAHWMPGVAVTAAPQAPRASSRSIHIASYDRAQRNHESLLTVAWGTVVCDEAHALKNREAKRTQRICGHEDYRDPSKNVPGLLPRARFRFLLSGTPVPNRPVEMIQPLIGLDRLKELGGFGGFASRYCGWMKGVPGSINGAVMQNLPELNQRLRATCWVRRLKADVMKDLPPKFTNHVPLALANPARYQAAARDVFSFLDKDPNEAEALVQLTTLRRVAAEEKVAAAIEWVENFIDSGEKLVLMGWHNAPLEAIHAAFPGSVILTGSTSGPKREEAVRRFQNDPECKLFIGNIQAAGEAITLTAASHLAFLELPWKPGQVDQASDRIHRIGQTAEQVTYHFLLAEGTIDEMIADLIDEKRRVVKAIEDGKEVAETQLVGLLMRRLRDPNASAKPKPQRIYEASAEDRYQGAGEWA